MNGKERLLEDVFFSGLQDQFGHAHLKQDGKVDLLGICFMPEGFFPFLKIPVSEFKNQLLGADEVGFKLAHKISEKLKEAPDVSARLIVLENELVELLNNDFYIPENFHLLFNRIKKSDNSQQITQFCEQNNIGLRKLERMFNKYVGVAANTYTTLNRFHESLNQILQNDYSKFSDIAYSNEYFDQMHFIREFKRFTGNTPKSFVKHNNSILQIGKFYDASVLKKLSHPSNL